MATRTAQTSADNLWSNTASWVEGAVPVSGDSVTIPIGVTTIFDVNQSGFAAGLAGLVINGTLVACTTAGTYYLKMAAHITGTGTFRAGTNPDTGGARYPSNCLFSYYANGNYNINCGANAPRMTLDLWCHDPVVTRSWIVPPAGARSRVVITGITQANPCVITAPSHGFQVGDEVVILDVSMKEITVTPFLVKTVPTSNTLTLRWLNLDTPVDSRTFTAYTSGGILCTKYAVTSASATINTHDDLSSNAEWTRSGALATVLTPAQTNTYYRHSISAVGANTVTLGATVTNIRSGGAIVLTTRNVNLIFAHTSNSNQCVTYANGNFDCASYCPGSFAGSAYYSTISFRQTRAGVTHFMLYGIYPGGGSYRNGDVVCGGTFVAVNNVFAYTSNITFTGACFGTSAAITSGQACGDYSGLFYNCGQYSAAWNASGCYTHDAEFIGGYMPCTGSVISTFKNCLFKFSTNGTATGKYHDCYFQNSVKGGEYYGCRFFGIVGAINLDYANGAIPSDTWMSRCLIGTTYAMSSVNTVSTAQNVPSNQLMHGYSIMNYHYHDGSAVVNNFHRGWTHGGTLATQDNAVTPLLSQASRPATVTAAHEITCVAKLTGSYADQPPAFFDFPVTGCAGVPIQIQCWIVKNTNSMTETPRIQIVDQSYTMMDPAHILAETVMADNTDWQQLSLNYTPIVDGQLFFRVRCVNSTGLVQFSWSPVSSGTTVQQVSIF